MATVTAAQRKMFAKMGIAMPDGSYYVRNGSDLRDAIDSVGRGESAGDSGSGIRRHIIARAKSLHLEDKIPATWNSDGSLKHGNLGVLLSRLGVDPLVEDRAQVQEAEIAYEQLDRSTRDYIEHFGVRGMKWGVRKSRGAPEGASEDHARATEIKGKVKAHGGVHALSNDELKVLTDRLNLESNYSRLAEVNKSEIEKGRSFLKAGTSDVKSVIDAVNTGRSAYKLINDLKKSAAPAG